RDGLRTVSANGHDGVNAQLGRIGNHLVRDIAHALAAVLGAGMAKGIAAIGGAQYCSAARKNSADILKRKFVRLFRPDKTVEPVRNADDSPSVFEESGLYRSTDYCVEARSIAASGTNADAADVRHAQGSGRDSQLRGRNKVSSVAVVG